MPPCQTRSKKELAELARYKAPRSVGFRNRGLYHRKICGRLGMMQISLSAEKKLQLVSWTFSGMSIVGLSTTSWRPDSRPVLFAFSLRWVINVVVFVLTYEHWLRMDVNRFRFAGWEKEGRIYRWAGVDIFRWVRPAVPLGQHDFMMDPPATLRLANIRLSRWDKNVPSCLMSTA